LISIRELGQFNGERTVFSLYGVGIIFHVEE
jgi:hypothetical protein